MSNAVLRARVWALLGLLAVAPLATAQTLETFAGDARLVNAPGSDVPAVSPGVAVAADGSVWARGTSRLLRLNPADGTVSDIPARLEFRAAAFDPAGRLHAVQGSNVYRVDTSTGALTRVAGNLTYGGCCDWVPATQSSFRQPGHIAFDSLGNLYIPDSFSNSVRVVGTDGIVRPFAGGNYPGGQWGDGGLAVNAGLNWPTSVAVDANNNVYIADDQGSRIRRVDAQTGIITAFAGDPSGIIADGFPASQSYLPNIGRMAFNSAGDLVINVTGDLRIRRIVMATGLVYTIAGNRFYGFSGDGGPATSASLSFGESFALDASDNLYIADFGAKRIRKVAHDTGIITTVLGNGTEGFCGDVTLAVNACLLYPQGLALDPADDVFIADSYNGRIRKVSIFDGVLRTIAGGELGVHSGDGGPAINATFGQAPLNTASDAAGNLFIAGGHDNRVRRIDAASGLISTIAGTGVSSSTGDGGLAAAATLKMPTAVAVDSAGNLYIAESGGHRIRRVDSATGFITTIAGTGSPSGALGDNGPAVSASLVNPSALALDAAGNLLVADRLHGRIRKIDITTGIITTVVGNGTLGTPTGDGGPALAAAISAPEDVVTDAAGNIYFSTYYGLRKVDASSGIITLVSGRNGGLADTAGERLVSPTALKFDSQGRLYVADGEYNRIWRITGLTAPPDTSAPEIEAHVAGTPGTNGWHVSDVQVTWTVTDEQSAVSSSTGCESTSFTQDTAGVTLTCTATSAGGSASNSVTIRRDATAPTLSFGAASPAAGAGGWNSTDVSIPFSTNDNLSGVASTNWPSPVVIGGEGANLSENVTVTDAAGNSTTSPSPPVNIDRLPPVVQAVVTGTLGTNGWYTSNIQVSWSINKSPASILASTGCDSTLVTTDTAGITFSCSVTSAAGSASSSVNVKRDATPPVLTFGTPTPAPNANGWINNKANVLFTRSDAMSGVNTTSSNSPLVISTDGAGITGQVVVTDRAGNVGTFTTVPLNIDRTPPVVSLVSPANNAVYGLLQNNVVASFSCTDVSLAGCVGTAATGTPINTATSGERSFRVTATDLVNLTTQVTYWYRVASTFNFQGFLAPMNAAPILNQVAPGAVVPVRFRLPDGNGGFVTDTAAFTSATVASLTCGSATVVPLNDTASGPLGISFDAGSNTFTYNWATDAGWTGCRKLTLRLRDNSQRELRFRFQ